MHDFDELIDRTGTNSLKHDFAAQRGKPDGLLSLWVADMDFKSPPAVIEALERRARHGIFGYSDPRSSYGKAVTGWFKERLGCELDADWLVPAPGVVFALNMCVRAYTKPGDSCLIQSPVYYPFASSIIDNKRTLLTNSLVLENGQYRIDFDDLEEKMKRAKLFILCSPHNPVGRVWTREELVAMGELAKKYHTLVVSDEIHCDFVYSNNKHVMFSSLPFNDNLVLCTAPSKTFNLAGLHNANIFIPDKTLRQMYEDESNLTGISQLCLMGLDACEAAYLHGGPWLEDLLAYLKGNIDLVRSFLKEKLPKVKLIEPQGTYLLWLDFRELANSEEELERILVEKAKLWLDIGGMFGPEGKGFARMNVASPRSVIKEALERLEIGFR
ncbi:MAG: pyridoxal phosphate-dependent aminotransferase [Clostridiales bacterium]|nr:pyridoxal phosphate-dependent aminotransferase [Clostridiales bacterium]